MRGLRCVQALRSDEKAQVDGGGSFHSYKITPQRDFYKQRSDWLNLATICKFIILIQGE